MPYTLRDADFEPVRSAVYSRLAGRAYDNKPAGDVFLTPQNLAFIFRNYVERYENETGWQIDPQTHRLDAFAALVYDAYLMGMCKYRAPPGASRLDVATLVQRWNDDAIGAIVFNALKETRKKTNYLRRARDPLYGRRSWTPVQLTKPSVSKREDAYRYTYQNIARGKRPYSMMVPDD